MGYDHYAAARGLADRLAAEGQRAWAEKLVRVMAEGATGTEIFMGLRWRLQQLERRGDSLSDGAKERIGALLKELDAALR